jgi:hypothetical protein
VYQIVVAAGELAFAAAVTLRLPYADMDHNGVVDGTTVSEAALTLWRYATEQSQWVEVPGAVVIPDANVVVVDTFDMGVVGLFQADNGSVATVGSAADDVVALGTAQSGATPAADASWETLAMVSRGPYVTAWDTTVVYDGDYELRTVCAADASDLAAFHTAEATPNGSNSSNCFIATAAYGSPLAPQVQMLREFRDRYLRTTRPGRWMVDVYSRLSPPLAEVIRGHALLRTGARVALAPVVWTVRLGMGQAGWSQYAVAGCLVLGLVGCGWQARRRRSQ